MSSGKGGMDVEDLRFGIEMSRESAFVSLSFLLPYSFKVITSLNPSS